MAEKVTLWPGGPEYEDGKFKITTDSVLLADFAGRGRSIIDLCCGAGIIALLLSVNNPGARVCGLELDEAEAALAAKNVPGARILAGDVRDARSLYAQNSFDLAAANPPYFAPGASTGAHRDERACSLPELCAAAGWLLKTGGRLCLVHRPERLADIFSAMQGAGLEPKRLRLVCPREGSAPSLILAEGRRGGKSGLDILRPLILCKPDGAPTDEVRRIYRREDD